MKSGVRILGSRTLVNSASFVPPMTPAKQDPVADSGQHLDQSAAVWLGRTQIKHSCGIYLSSTHKCVHCVTPSISVGYGHYILDWAANITPRPLNS